jgi:predicted neuraminidase
LIKNYKKEFVFDFDTAPTPSCHASTVLPLDDGTVLAAWFGGTAEGKDDVVIWVSRRTENGWEKPIQVSDSDNIPHWNPVLHLRQDGSICLYFKVGKKVAVWQTYYSISTDNGKTWTKQQVLVPGEKIDGRGPVKNKCLRLSNGTLLGPASTEQKRMWRCFIDISEDDGRTWTMSPFIVRPRTTFGVVGMIQPTLWEGPEGHVHALMRTDKGKIYRSDSTNYGRTWCKAYPTSLPNNNSGIDLVKVPDGRIFLLYNNVADNWGKRNPLTLAVSTDNGDTWENIMDLETDDPGEFSYPAITYKDGSLHMTYTHNRERIAYWKMDI